MTKKKLYIIGNGFDLHHWQGTNTKPNTGYQYFGDYLKTDHPETFDWLVKTCGLLSDPWDGSDSENIWANFESALAYFYGEEILDYSRKYMEDSNPHRSGEASWVANKIVDDLTTNLKTALKQHILGLPYPNDISSIAIPIEFDALFLSFNYTDTLERYYSIHRNNICYIHGKVKEDLEFGHGVSTTEADRNRIEPSSPANLTPEQYVMWRDEMADQYSFSYELTIGEIEQYWSKSFKDAEKNINSNNDFFGNFDEIEEVIVMGHSLADVDLPYFDTIRKLVSSDATWSVSYHAQEDKKKFKRILTVLGVPEDRINLFTLLNLTA